MKILAIEKDMVPSLLRRSDVARVLRAVLMAMPPLWCSACFDKPSDSVYALECRVPSSRACFGRCGEGTQKCIDGYWQPCMKPKPNSDEYCDAPIAACENGVVRLCGSQLGDCAGNSQTCEEGNWGDCSGNGPSVETCDGKDNNCNGVIDDGCACVDGTEQSCGVELGACTTGMQSCHEGIWSTCSGTGPSEEICDGKDNNCNGEIDEGFSLGTSCERAGGCPGRLKCAESGEGTVCAIDTSRIGPESCDGKDNDCDGLVDYSVTQAGLQSACECRSSSASLESPSDRSSENQVCTPRQCAYVDGKLSMVFCLDCRQQPLPYALCETSVPFDMARFDGSNSDGSLLEVRFEYLSSTSVLAPINLWYRQADGPRKYVPLLGKGEPPGKYTRVVEVTNTCLPQKNDWGTDCVGALSGSQCGCAPTDTCGKYSGCSNVDFSRAVVQLAAEWCDEGSTTFSGEVRIESIRLLSRGCLASSP